MGRARKGTFVRGGALLLVVGLAACGGSGTEPGPAIPNIIGEYSGTWTQDLTVDGQAIPLTACPCTLFVPSQTDSVFFGRSVLSAPCDQGLLINGAGGVLSIGDGKIETSGALTFRFSGDPQAGVNYGGCMVTTWDAFTGTFAGGTITASRRAAYDCAGANGPRVTLTTRLVATRR